MNVSRSWVVPVRLSAVRNAMRLESSGMTTLISNPRAPASFRALRVTSRAASEFCKFRSDNDPTSASAGRGAATLPTIRLREESVPATMRCRAVNSHAQRGRGGLNNFLTGSRTLVNERHLIDFLQRGFACQNLGDGAVTQRSHAFLMGGTFNFRR